jgi:predicted kinase
MQRFLLQMAGESGAGKSTLALAVGQATGAVVLDKDVIAAPLCEKEGLTPPQAGGYAYAMLFPLAASLLGQGFNVIIDSAAFWVPIRERGEAIAHSAGVNYRIVECRCPDAKLQQTRLLSRSRLITQPGSVADLAASLSRPGVVLEVKRPYLVVDTRQPLAGCAEQVLEYLRS